jgi:deoxyribonuclease-4
VVRCRELGIDALEMAWVHRVTMTEGGSRKVRQAARDHSIALSVHAPYYINLNSRDQAKVEASKDRIEAAVRAAAWCGASDVVIHAGFYHDDQPSVVTERVAEALLEVRQRVGASADLPTLRPEVMGKTSQYGDLEEILELSRVTPGIEPCIDVAHLHARSGAYNSRSEFEGLWSEVADVLGPSALTTTHLHISGIDYGPAGEKRHQPLGEADFDYRTFLEVLHEQGIGGRLIVESPARESDVMLLQQEWLRIRESG